MMVVLSSGRRAFQKMFLQLPCLRTRQFSVVMDLRRHRDEYCSTGAYFSFLSQRQPSRLPRTAIQDLARSGAMFLLRLMSITHMDGIALGTDFGR